ncbi:39S ribosomal protein L34, mitochondrial [Coccinella septempunctata]|uniref:39S ribosomal protein L34, mitochondrial n=1 Tax=Coccinella septempunctata TaxID=41139 RepID=UPI001D063D5A|nr:39S ribosomal protein L34, mitochondrial [Coccinella septempunctata]
MQCLARITSGFFRSPSATTSTLISNPILERIGGTFDLFTRNIVRNHFPRPNETRRVRRHGFKTRISTPTGRRVLMNRILKGRHVISH